MAGNVWEWTTSHLNTYPQGSAVPVADFTQSKDFTPEEMVVPLRGGSYYNDSTYVRCRARVRNHPDYFFLNFGFRVVAAPNAHTFVLNSVS
jgi:formylglycine-generating enzyme required for sulfatase activity